MTRRRHPLIALVASLAFLAHARGAIVYFEPLGGIAIPNTFAGVSVDLETGNSSTSIDGLAGGDANFFLGGARVSNDADADATSATWQPIRVGTGNTDAIRQLAPGTTIDMNTASYSTGFGASGQASSHFGGADGFTDGVAGYLGFSLIIGAQTVYGWALVTFEDNDGVGTLHAWAYEDTGAAIQVAAVPEPAPLIMVGTLGCLLLLRRRHAYR